MTDRTYDAVQPNIDTDGRKKNVITHANPQLHISDCSTKEKKRRKEKKISTDTHQLRLYNMVQLMRLWVSITSNRMLEQSAQNMVGFGEIKP